MKALYDATHEGYRLKNDFSDGYPPFAHMERPERVEAVLAALARLGIEVERVRCEVEPPELGELHDPEYVGFLRVFCAGLGEGEEVIPAIFNPRDKTARAPARHRLGSFTNEIGTPLVKVSFDTATAGFSLALEGARRMVTDGEERFCLTRPPGHHAGRARYGGYCLFNNAAGAARELAKEGGMAAVLDVDYHIGDGTLELATAQTPYFSLHADPSKSYPYRAYAEADHPHCRLEALEPGVDAAGYLERLGSLVDEVTKASPSYVVVSLGFDTLGEDYIQDEHLGVEVETFREVGRIVRAIPAPKLFLLEGGYDPRHLEDCVYNFFAT